jgi:hypothetical protein
MVEASFIPKLLYRSLILFKITLKMGAPLDSEALYQPLDYSM